LHAYLCKCRAYLIRTRVSPRALRPYTPVTRSESETTPATPRNPFRLRLYFLATSLIAMAILAASVGWLNAWNTRNLLVKEVEGHAVEFTQHLALLIDERLTALHDADGTVPDLSDPAFRAELDRLIRDQIHGLPVEQVNIFDDQGVVLFSLDPDLVGRRADEHSGVSEALAGRLISELEAASTESDLTRTRTDHPRLETYVPFPVGDMPQAPAMPFAAVETYQDATHIVRQADGGFRTAFAISVYSCLVLVGVLYVIVARADGTLRRQQSQLEEWTRTLEQRVVARTADLSRSTENTRRLFNGITDGIAVLTPDLRVTELNDSLRRFTTLNGDPLPPDAACYRLYAGRTQPCPDCPARETFATDTAASAVLSWEVDSKTRHFEVSTFPLSPEAGGSPRVIEYIKEITERRQMEQQLVQADRLASVGVLASGIAHEINNPLASVAQCTEALAREMPAGDPAVSGAPRYLDIIRREIDRCKTTLTGLLTFARPSASARELTDVCAIIRDTHALLKFHFEERGVRWELHAPSEPCFVVTDGAKLRQVLFNLLHNAADASADTHGTVRCEVVELDGSISIRVIDSGKGMSKDTLDRAFDPFFTTKPTSEGTGLGLAIAYGLTHELGGSLSAHSEGPGCGSTFTLELPCSRVAAA